MTDFTPAYVTLLESGNLAREAGLHRFDRRRLF